MAALKWIVVVLFSLGAVGALAFGASEGGSGRLLTQRSAPLVSLRAFPGLAVVGAVAPAPAAAAPAEGRAQPIAEPAVAKAAEPAAAKPAEPVAAKPPEPVAAKPAEPAAAKPPPPPVAEGTLNLRASDTADVYLDGKKLGGSPLLGVKARVGPHKVRFDCYDSAGNTLTGTVQSVAVKAEGETDIEFPCPAE